MKIIFFGKSIPEAARNFYISSVADSIPNSFYLNLSHLNDVFRQPVTSEFTSQYSYDQRIVNPGHAALLGLARDNLKHGKVALLEGDFDYTLVDSYIRTAQSSEPEFAPIVKAISFDMTERSANGLSNVVQENLNLNRETNTQTNLHSIFNFLNVKPNNETSQPGILVMAAGVAGSGKTTHLHAACPQVYTSVYLDKDVVANAYLDEVGADMPSPYYNKHVKSQSYEVLFRFACDQLRLNKTPVLDGCFGDRLTGALISNHLANCKYVTTLIYFQSSGETQYKRILKRGAERDFKKLQTGLDADRKDALSKHLSDFSQIDPASSVGYVNTENDSHLEANVKKIIAHMTSAHLISLRMLKRPLPFAIQITNEEVQGGLEVFQAVLVRTIEKSRFESLSRHYFNGTRYTMWDEKNSLKRAPGEALNSLAANSEPTRQHNFRHL
jgi:predicted kinase